MKCSRLKHREGVFFMPKMDVNILAFMHWAIQHPPILPLLFGVILIICFTPTFYYLLKMIYSPCKNLQGGENYEGRGSGNKTRRIRIKIRST